MTITEFLTARYAEEFEEATNARYDADDHWWLPDYAAPKRVLADIAAKRAILADHEESDDYPHICTRCYKEPGWPESDWEDTMHEWPCPTIRLLAQPYAEHADFDLAWRVT